MPADEPNATDAALKWVVRIALVGVAFLVISSLIRLVLIAMGAL